MMAANTSVALRKYGQNSKDSTETLRQKQERLVREHGRLVRTVAHRIFRRLPKHVRGFEEEDLVSVGILGLLDANERWDENSGIAFETFAEFRIKGAILDEIRRHDFFPRRLRARANLVKKTEARLEAELGRYPTDAEMAEAMEIPSEDFQKLKGEVAQYVFVPEEDCISLQSPFPSQDQVLAAHQLKEQLRLALEDLPEKEKLVLDLYYNHELKLKEIADILEVTEGRVSQIKSEAHKRLKLRLRAAGAL
ncbi:MAG: FliA/WhiG family RNA polymerase sigma factor [bacterium]